MELQSPHRKASRVELWLSPTCLFPARWSKDAAIATMGRTTNKYKNFWIKSHGRFSFEVVIRRGGSHGHGYLLEEEPHGIKIVGKHYYFYGGPRKREKFKSQKEGFDQLKAELKSLSSIRKEKLPASIKRFINWNFPNKKKMVLKRSGYVEYWVEE